MLRPPARPNPRGSRPARQEYTLRKRGETLLRSVQYGKKGISAVPPDYYAVRFSRFLARIMV